MVIEIPGFGKLDLQHLVLDYNGTLAVDGELAPGVAEDLTELSSVLQVHVVTADTFGRAAKNLEGIPCTLSILGAECQDEAKLEYIRFLGSSKTVAMGNGRNDRRMLRAAALGVAVMLEEGAAAETLAAADVVCVGIRNALHLLLRPLRLTATLRS